MNFDANPRMGRHKTQFYYSEWFILKTELYDGQSLAFLWNFCCCFFAITDWMFVVWWNAINSWVHYEIRIDFSLFRDLFEEMNNPTTLIYSIFHNFLVTKKKSKFHRHQIQIEVSCAEWVWYEKRGKKVVETKKKSEINRI